MANHLILDAYAGKRILITGARGYIGSSLAKLLSVADCCLIFADRTGMGWMPENSLAEILNVKVDLTTEEGWRHVLHDVDYVFHLASVDYDRRSFDWEKDLTDNFMSVARMLAVCKELPKSPRIVFASSANVVGGTGNLDMAKAEDPVSIWSVHKLMAEKYLRVYALKDDIPAISLRLANVYGPTANSAVNNRVVLNRVICRAIEGQDLTLLSNRNLKRDFVHVEDASRAFIMAGCTENASAMDGRQYYVGSGQPLSFNDIWRLIADEVGRNTGRVVHIVNDDSVLMDPLDMRSSSADIPSLENAFGWSPAYSPIEGIPKSIAAFLNIKV